MKPRPDQWIDMGTYPPHQTHKFPSQVRLLPTVNGKPARGRWPFWDKTFTSAVEAALLDLDYHASPKDVGNYMDTLINWHPVLSEGTSAQKSTSMTVFKAGIRSTAHLSLCVSIAGWDERDETSMIHNRP
jgi:hypothetical protein